MYMATRSARPPGLNPVHGERGRLRPPGGVDDHVGAVAARHLQQAVVGIGGVRVDRLARAELFREIEAHPPPVEGDGLGAHGPRGLDCQQPDRPAPQHRHPLARLHPGAAHGVEGDGRGLDEGGLLAGHGLRQRDGFVGAPEHVLRQPAVESESRDGHVRAHRLLAGGAASARAAGEHRVQGHAVAGADVRDALARIDDRPSDLVAGDEGQGAPGDRVGRAVGDEVGAVQVLLDVGGAYAAVVDAQLHLAGPGLGLGDVFEPEGPCCRGIRAPSCHPHLMSIRLTTPIQIVGVGCCIHTVVGRAGFTTMHVCPCGRTRGSAPTTMHVCSSAGGHVGPPLRQCTSVPLRADTWVRPYDNACLFLCGRTHGSAPTAAIRSPVD